MPKKPDLDKVRRRIIARLEKLRNELQQTIRDKEWWNNNRTEHPPFDVGWDRVILKCVDEQLAAWNRGDIAAVNAWGRRMAEHAKTSDESEGTDA